MDGRQQEKSQKMLAQLAQAFSAIPFNQLLGLQLTQLTSQEVSMTFHMKNELIGNFFHGILHGGVISSVLDMAGGMIVMADAILKHIDKPDMEITSIIGTCSTVDLQISYLHPGRGDLFTSKAITIKSGRKISFARMELYNEENVLIATGSGTYAFK